jgi:deoxyribonuclease-2
MILFLRFAQSLVSCQSPNGSNVDWCAALKIPTLSQEPVVARREGIAYLYHDENVPLSEANGTVLSQTVNPLYHTLKPIFSRDCNVGYVLLNDQPPDSTASSTYAHLKGVIIFDRDNGLYLTHSVPGFPPDPSASDFDYPSSGTKYGQAFQCLTISHQTIDILASGLLVARPYRYAHNFPIWAESVLETLKRVISGEYLTAETNKVISITTIGGKQYQNLIKSRSWGLDLYHDLVAPTYQGNVIAETWGLGGGNLGSDCTGNYEAHDVVNLNFSGIKWKRTNDHSKWAVIGDNMCIGDINRQHGQLARGGGTFCAEDREFAADVRKAIVNMSECISLYGLE